LVTYSPFLFLSKTAIPVDGVVATRCPAEPINVVVCRTTKSKVGSNSPPIPIMAEKNGVTSTEARKGPLSSLATRKTFTSDLSPKETGDNGVTETVEEVASLRGHRGWVKTVLFSSDRTLVVSGGLDGSIKLWRFAHDGVPEQTVPHVHPGGVQALSLTADKNKLVSAAAQPDGTVRLWDLSSTKPKLRAILQVPKAPVESLAFSLNGNLLAIGCDKTILLWNVTKPALREECLLSGHTQVIKSMAFAPDGRSLISGGADGTVRLWSTRLPEARELAVLENCQDGVLSLTFSRDGQLAAWQGLDHAVHVWEVNGDAPRQQNILRGHEGLVRLALFPEEPHRLLTVDDKNWIILWDLASATKIRRWQLPGGTTIASVGCTPDGRYAVAGTMGIVIVYRLYPKNKYSPSKGRK
jgi:WD40 repeat protein